MAKSAFDLLCDNVSRQHEMMFSMVKTVAAHSVWIKIFSTMLLALLTGFVALWVKS